MAYRARFDCLWCGAAWHTRGPDDLEGWAQLCPTCLGNAGASPFRRDRVRSAISARAAASRPPERVVARPALPGSAMATAFPDDWFLRRGEFERGPLHDTAWHAELDMVTRWLDDLGLEGRIAEPAAGVGFLSPLLAERGELHASDTDAAALDRARDRLLAHRLVAHIHVADPWAAPAAPEGPAAPAAAAGAGARTGATGLMDALVAAFLLGRVRGAGLDGAAASLRARLAAGGRLAVIELRPDAAGGPPPGVAWTFHAPAVVEATLIRAGFDGLDLRTTGRFFLTVSAVAR
jgi:hypothetical protein